MKKTFYYLFGVMVLSTLLACNGGQKNNDKEDMIAPRDPRTDFSMERSHEDTTAVLELAKQFLESLKSGDIDGALGQLYEIKEQEAAPLSAERRNELRKALSVLPVQDYKVDELYLYSDSDTEVRYSIVMFEKPANDTRPNTTNGSVNPYRIDGKWYLTIEDRKVETNNQDD